MVHVQQLHGVPHSSQLRRGERVRDMDEPPRGLIIATFDGNGRYANAVDGSSHIAILLAKNTDGLLVVDQWLGQPVHERTISYRNGSGSAANDADRFYSVLTDDA
jgi:hypothetical protein